MQADVRTLEGDGGDYIYGYGLRVRSDGTNANYYEFNTIYDGRYMSGKSNNWEFSSFVDWTFADSLVPGYGHGTPRR